MCVIHSTHNQYLKKHNSQSCSYFMYCQKEEDRVLEHAPNFLNRFMGALRNSYNII